MSHLFPWSCFILFASPAVSRSTSHASCSPVITCSLTNVSHLCFIASPPLCVSSPCPLRVSLLGFFQPPRDLTLFLSFLDCPLGFFFFARSLDLFNKLNLCPCPLICTSGSPGDCLLFVLSHKQSFQQTFTLYESCI